MKHTDTSFARRSLAGAVALGATLLAVPAAHAQSAGTWFGKIGLNQITPQVRSGDLSAPSLPGTRIDVKADMAAIVTVGRMLTDQIALEFYAGLPYEHKIVGDGAIAGVGRIGSVKQVSPTLFAQYRFGEAQAVLRPYAGLGLTYAYFYGEKGDATLTGLTNPGGAPTHLSTSAAFGLSPQLGVTVQLGPKWFLDASVVKTFLHTRSKLSTGQSISTDLDPVSTNISVGYRF